MLLSGAMLKLTHFRLCPFSRSIRLALGEAGIEPTLVEQAPWDLRPAFLGLNPAGELPVLELPGHTVLCGAYAISEFMAEEAPNADDASRIMHLLPGSREDRAEVRRLVDWFHGKLNREVTQPFLAEKVYAQSRTDQQYSMQSNAPNVELMRILRANLRFHLSYINFLADQRRWLAGDEISFADLAAAAHFSVLDYLGEVPWDEFPVVKPWYVRLKSRRSFRPLLADRLPGMPPPLAYTDLDF